MKVNNLYCAVVIYSFIFVGGSGVVLIRLKFIFCISSVCCNGF